MTEQQTLVEFLTARLDEDEAAARAAIDPERPGTHWQWVASETDTVVAHGDLDEAQEHQPVSLRSVEEFETRSVGRLPAFLIHHTEEVHAGAGEHIALHDPARVLREVAAKRAIVADHQIEAPYEIERGDEEFGCERCYSDELGVLGFGYCPTLKALAVVYSDHEAYREEWRP